MTFSSELRAATAVIQRTFPGIYVHQLDAGGGKADILVENAHDLALVLPNHGTPPGLVHCGDLRLRLSRLPQGLHQVGAGVMAGKVAVVSGAASGLGLAIARTFYASGACVLFTDLDTEGLVRATAACDDRGRVLSAVVDVTNERSVAAGFDAALTGFGRVDTVACCAGVAPTFALQHFPLEQWELAVRINLTGCFLFAREAAHIMSSQGRGGAILVLSSMSSLEPGIASWALELGRDEIRINCIAHDEAHRAARPDDIANAALFFCSDAARGVTGQVLVL